MRKHLNSFLLSNAFLLSLGVLVGVSAVAILCGFAEVSTRINFFVVLGAYGIMNARNNKQAEVIENLRSQLKEGEQ